LRKQRVDDRVLILAHGGSVSGLRPVPQIFDSGFFIKLREQLAEPAQRLDVRRNFARWQREFWRIAGRQRE
jgi:hypothetical protein